MTSLRRALIGLGLTGVAAGVGSWVVVLTSDHVEEVQVAGLVLIPLIGFSFIGTGLFAWWRRPENNFGALMTLVGFVWFLASLTASDTQALFVIGGFTGALPFAFLIHLIVAFPAGRLQGRWEVALVVLAYFDTILVQVLGILFLRTGPGGDCTGCPTNPLLIEDLPGFSSAVFGIQAAIGLVGFLGVAILLVRRWREASPGYRTAVAPVLIAGLATSALLSISLIADITGLPDGRTEDVIDVFVGLAMASVPFGFLIGLLRSRLSRASAVSELVGRLAEADRRQGLRDALAAALGDSTLSLAYWIPEGEHFVDADGRPVSLPENEAKIACTPVEHDGRLVAMICHDAALDAEPELIQAAAGAASLTLENERLDAELRARVAELRASRARIVQAADDERRRLERDLHDGAQQRLVSLALNLRLAGAKLESEPVAARALLDESAAELGEATAELRELARGLHPAVLSDRGLGPAVKALASRAPLPVEVTVPGGERLDPAVESASYFVVSEALTNVARYAEASLAEVSVEREDGRVVIEVRDDGVGGADPATGSGLRGLTDRVAALDGNLEVVSPEGDGTVVRAVIPCE